MVFYGGPKDGEEVPPYDGFPAPGGCSYPDEDGTMHPYTRTETTEEGGQVRHVYVYDAMLKARENGDG